MKLTTLLTTDEIAKVTADVKEVINKRISSYVEGGRLGKIPSYYKTFTYTYDSVKYKMCVGITNQKKRVGVAKSYILYAIVKDYSDGSNKLFLQLCHWYKDREMVINMYATLHFLHRFMERHLHITRRLPMCDMADIFVDFLNRNAIVGMQGDVFNEYKGEKATYLKTYEGDYIIMTNYNDMALLKTYISRDMLSEEQRNSEDKFFDILLEIGGKCKQKVCCASRMLAKYIIAKNKAEMLHLVENDN